ncbi:MAG: hypothetical protein EBU84_05595 [Actinobacteria bacterium]|nr:hypothetical protein [Actinomycetota bacterium]
MCMLCVIPPNVLPSREKLENSALNNPDGFGYAIAIPQEKRIHVVNTMNADEAINGFLADKAKYPKGYAIWHARLATHGSQTLDNCHPFYIGKDKLSVLAHNGILPTEHEAKGTRSDTRIFAEHILPRMGGISALDDPQMWAVLEEFTAGSKVAFLTVNPQAKYQMYLLHEKAGKYDESEVWWSNTSHELSYYSKSYYSGTGWGSGYSHGGYVGGAYLDKWEKDHEKQATIKQDSYGVWLVTCDICSKDYEEADVYCPSCKSCYLCLAQEDACMCYISPDNYQAQLERGAW